MRAAQGQRRNSGDTTGLAEGGTLPEEGKRRAQAGWLAVLRVGQSVRLSVRRVVGEQLLTPGQFVERGRQRRWQRREGG